MGADCRDKRERERWELTVEVTFPSGIGRWSEYICES